MSGAARYQVCIAQGEERVGFKTARIHPALRVSYTPPVDTRSLSGNCSRGGSGAMSTPATPKSNRSARTQRDTSLEQVLNVTIVHRSSPPNYIFFQ